MDENVGTYDEFFDALGERESSDNYQLVNDGFLGRYQIPELVLVFGSTDPSLSYYNLDDDPTDNVYNGTWTGLDGVESLSDFLNNREAQDNLIRAWFDNILETFRSEDVLHYAGQTIDGTKISVTSLIAGAHLIGSPELIDYLESEKASVPEDQFGTPVTEYLELFAPFEVEPGGLEIDRSGAVSYTGSPGDDSFIGGGGDDTINGLSGTDTAEYTENAPNYLIIKNDDGTFTVRQTTGEQQGASGNEGSDRLIDVERVQFADQTLDLSEVDFTADGTFRPQEAEPDDPDDPSADDDNERPDVAFDNRFRGTDEADRRAGGENNDLFGGRGGDDTLGGRGGRDLLAGNDGDDVLGGGLGADTLRGDEGDDRMYGGDGDDVMIGGAGDDVGAGGAGADSMFGGTGADRLIGNGGGDRIDGGDGNDRLRGGDGDDTLIGGAGDDAIRGGDGDDVIRAGNGDDIMIGGEGADQFLFDGPGAGDNKIVDFEIGTDRINLTEYDLSGLEAIRFLQNEGGTAMLLGEEDRIRLVDVAQDDLRPDDFVI